MSVTNSKKISFLSVLSLLAVAASCAIVVSVAAFNTLQYDVYSRAGEVGRQIASTINELSVGEVSIGSRQLDAFIQKVLIGSPGFAAQIVNDSGEPIGGDIFARNVAWESLLFSPQSEFIQKFKSYVDSKTQPSVAYDLDGNKYLVTIKRFHRPKQYVVVASSARALDFEVFNRTIPWGAGSGIAALLVFAFSLWLQSAAFGRGQRSGTPLRRMAQRFYSESIAPPVALIPAVEKEQLPDYLPEMIVVLSKEGLVLAANASFLKAMNIAEDELNGRLFVNMVFEADQEKVRQSFRREAAPADESNEFRLVLDDENVVWVRELKRRHVPLDGESTTNFVLQNINEEKRAIEQLLDLKVKFNLLIKRMPSLLWITDSELKVQYSIGNGASQLNEIASDFSRKSIYELFDSPDGSVVAVAAHLRAMRGESAEYEFSLAQRHFEVAVEPRVNSLEQVIGTIAIARDVTIALQTERALRESEQRFKDVAEASSDWIWELDRNFAFSFLSERFLDVTKLSPGLLIGTKIWDIADTETEREKWESHQQRLSDRLPFRDFIYRVKSSHTKGRAVYFRVSGRPVYDDTGNFVGYRGTGTDISRQVEIESRAVTAERRLTEALDTINEGVALWDSEDKLVFGNDKYKNLYPACSEYVKVGVEYRKLVEINLAANTYADVGMDAQQWLEDDLERHRYPSGQFVQKLRDGRYILVSEKRTHDGGIVGIRSDISEIKQAEAELEASEQRAKGLMNAAVDGIITVDENAVIESYNPAARKMFGYTVTELMGQDVMMLFRYRDVSRFAELLQATVKGDKKVTSGLHEFVGIRKDRSEFPVVVSIADMRLADRQVFTVAIHDVSARKQAEEALSETEEATRTLYRVASSQNVVVERKIESILQLGNERFGTTFGALSHFSGDNMEIVAVHSGIGNVEPGIVIPINHSYCDKTRESSRVLAIADASNSEWAKHPAYIASKWRSYIGTRVTVRGEVYGTLYFCSQSQHPEPFSSIDEDILQLMSLWVGYELDRKMAEHQLREHQSQLAHVGRLSTMGEMATGLAHELNQPLAAIVNYSQGCVRRMQNGTDEPDIILQALTQISDQAARAGGIIRRLREFVKKRAPRRDRVDLNAIVQSCVSFVDLEAKKAQVTMKFSPAENLGHVKVDQIEIEQVLINLFVNAIDAMNSPASKKRELSIKTEYVPSEKMAMVICSDSGPGMTEDAREHVFDAFFTTKSSGMGMGLSISRSLIEAHKGRLWVESELGKGATFRFTVPIYDGVEHGGD